MDLLIYIGKAAGILTLFYLVYIAVLQKDTLFTAKRHYLLGGILVAITFPFIVFTNTIYVKLPANNPVIFTEMLPVEQIPIQEAISFNWWQIVLVAYALGAGFMMLRFMKQLISLINLLHKYPSERKNGYRYVITSENTPPFSFFRNIVYNPEIHSQEELAMILKHEEVHASQWHSVDIIATNLLLIFQWMNPLAWFYKKGVEENLEFIADNATAQQIESVKQYQLALVKASSASPIPALTNNFYQSFIKKRIVMLNKRTSKKINVWKLMLVLPLLAVFLWSFNVKEVVAYTEAKEPEFTLTNSLSASEGHNGATSESKNLNSSIAPSEEIVATITPQTEAAATSSPASRSTKNISEENNNQTISKITDQNVEVTIKKNATKSELDAIKADLKAGGVTFDYSNLKYNSAKEIIGITITYKDAGGNSGTYSVNSDEPINNIIIKSDGNRLSVRSAGNSSYNYSNDEDEEVVRARNDRQQARMDMRHEKMENRRAEMENRSSEMREEMEVRRTEMRDRQRAMEEHREVIITDRDSAKTHTLLEHSENGGLFETHEDHESEDVIIKDRKQAREDRAKSRRDHRSLFSDNAKRITKNSTKNDLDKLAKEFEGQGVTFSYSGLKRNDVGEITKIKLKIKDNKGSTTSTTFDNDGAAIETILIDTSNGISVTKGRSH